MPAMVAGSSKRNQGKADSGELVDLAEILWLGVMRYWLAHDCNAAGPGLGFKVKVLGLRVQGLWFRVWGLRLKVQGLGFRV